MDPVLTAASLMIAIVEDHDGVRAVGIQSRSLAEDHRHTLTPAEARGLAEALVIAAAAVERGVELPQRLAPTASDDEIADFISETRTLERLRGRPG